jgi:hypothetical protein
MMKSVMVSAIAHSSSRYNVLGDKYRIPVDDLSGSRWRSEKM